MGVVGSYFLIGIIPNLAILCHATPSVWVLGGTQAGHNCCIRWILAAKQPKRPSVVGGKHQKCHRATLTVLALLSVDDCFTGSLSSSAAAVNEGSAVTYTATLNKVSATDLNIPYTLGGTATLTADYTGSVATTGNIKIVAGALTGTLVLTAVNDAKTEGAETVSVTLGATAGVLAGATTTVTTTITDSTPIKISATATTGTATTAFDEFTIAAGNYSANIIGFGTGDTLLFDANTVRSVTNISVADGNLTVTGSLNNQLVTLNLTGINPALDTQIIDIASFVSVFAPVGPATTTAISSTTTTGTASGGVDTFNIASGNYIASIAGFGVKDKLVFTPGSVEAITNTSVTDGNITVTGSFNNQFVTIQLTGVSTALDSGVFDVQSFNTVFGIGSLV